MRRGLLRQLIDSKKALTGLILLALFALLALLAPVLAPGDPSLINSTGSQAPRPHTGSVRPPRVRMCSPSPCGGAQFALRRVHRGARGDRRRHRRRPRRRVLRPRRGRRADPGHQHLPAAAWPAAAHHPGRVPAARDLHRDPGPRRHRLGGLGPGPARAGQVDPRQGLRGRRRRHRRTPPADHVPRDPAQHGVRGDDHAARLRDLRHRRPGLLWSSSASATAASSAGAPTCTGPATTAR